MPPGGVYTNVPVVFAVAFNCVGPSAVPATIFCGAGHVMIGVCAFATVTDTPVADVLFNTIKVHGKTRRLGRRIGRKPDWKKAIVTIASGQKIEKYFVEGV